MSDADRKPSCCQLNCCLWHPEQPRTFAIAKFPASSVKCPNHNKLASNSPRKGGKNANCLIFENRVELRILKGPHVGNRHSFQFREALRRESAGSTPSGGVGNTGRAIAKLWEELGLCSLRPMMCAVISRSFWAERLSKSPRTPQPSKLTNKTELTHKIDGNFLWDNALFKAFVQ